MKEKSENFNSVRPILFELCKKNYRGGGQIDPPSRNSVNMIQNTLEDNNMDKAIFYKWTKREKLKWRVLAERGNV